MPEPLPLNFQVAPFPATFTPVDLNTFVAALAARLTATPNQSYGLFVTGTVAPSTNVGPWLKDNGDGTQEWYFWNSTVGAYETGGVKGGYFVALADTTFNITTDGNPAAVTPYRDEELDSLEVYNATNNRVTITPTSAGLWRFKMRAYVTRTTGSDTPSAFRVRLYNVTTGQAVYTQSFATSGSTCFVDYETPLIQVVDGSVLRPEYIISSASGTDVWRISNDTNYGGFFSGQRF